jgi:DNA-directed RNA polymerase II subunit RPB9
MSVRLRFCPDCNNILEHRENPKRRVLQYACRTCSYVENCDQASADDMCVHRRDVSFTYREKLRIPPDVIHDPTLSRTFEYHCQKCPNTEAVFWQLPESQQDDSLALMFVCCGCGTSRKEGKQ